MERLKFYLEDKIFGVCEYLGEKLGIPTKHIRLFFIYASFLAMGSPVFLYLAMAFVLRLRQYVRGVRNPLLDL